MAEKLLDLGKHYQTAQEIESGKWFDLTCGLRVHVARANSPEFQKWMAAAHSRFAKRKDRIPPDKVSAATRFVMSRACFKAFEGPDGEKKVAVGKEVLEDSIVSREWILENLPDLAEEIAEFAGMTAEEFAQELESAGKA